MPPIEARETMEPTDLVRGTVQLTDALWGLLVRDAETINRPVSFVVREILGGHYKLAQELYQPLRRHRRKVGD